MDYSRRILAIDAGYTCMGFAVYDIKLGGWVECGTIETKKSHVRQHIRAADDHARRCGLLMDGLMKISRVSAVVCELPTGGTKNARAASCMASASAVVASYVRSKRLPVEWTTPRQGKLALAGRVGARKVEMIEAAMQIAPNLDWPPAKFRREAIADAMASLISCWDGQMVRMMRPGVPSS
tara:strand:- start:214 stop:756 length:543 start_codon:yes stop_codon:yes gene_type:complete